MRIGKLAKAAHVSRDTIRFYERCGLIQSVPGNSASNTYREYPTELIEKLAIIKEAQNAGFSISDLVYFINQLEVASSDIFDAEIFLQTKINQVESNIQRQGKFLETLKTTKNSLMHDFRAGSSSHEKLVR